MYEVAFSVLFRPFFLLFSNKRIVNCDTSDDTNCYNYDGLINLYCRRRTETTDKICSKCQHIIVTLSNRQTLRIYIYYTRLKEMGLLFSVLLSTLRPNTNKIYATLENPILLLFLHCWSNGIVLHLTIPYYSYFNVFVQYCISHFI